jgi:hypothetical protein
MKALIMMFCFVGLLISSCTQQDQPQSLSDIDQDWNYLGTIGNNGRITATPLPGSLPRLESQLLIDINLKASKRGKNYVQVVKYKIYDANDNPVLIVEVKDDTELISSVGVQLVRHEGKLFIKPTEKTDAPKNSRTSAATSSLPPTCENTGKCGSLCILDRNQQEGYYDCYCSGSGGCSLVTHNPKLD